MSILLRGFCGSRVYAAARRPRSGSACSRESCKNLDSAFLMDDEICLIAHPHHPIMKKVRKGTRHNLQETPPWFIDIHEISQYEFILSGYDTILGKKHVKYLPAIIFPRLSIMKICLLCLRLQWDPGNWPCLYLLQLSEIFPGR